MLGTSLQSSETLAQLRTQLEKESSDGLQLLKNLANNPICSVELDDAVPCIKVTWNRYATSTQLRFIHESILQLLAEHRVSKILGDDTALPTIHQDDQTWITEDWMPRAIAAGLRSAASKCPESYFGKLSTDTIRLRAPHGLNIRFFSEHAAALAWLQSVES